MQRRRRRAGEGGRIRHSAPRVSANSTHRWLLLECRWDVRGCGGRAGLGVGCIPCDSEERAPASAIRLSVVTKMSDLLIRGRYAPSPTGDLHLGNLRTALVAWLFARSTGGQFVLRIEDLDRPRVRPGATERMLSDLRWLGLDCDEGPDIGRPYAPYTPPHPP